MSGYEWIAPVVLAVGVVALGAWVAVLQVRFVRLQKQYERMMAGVERGNLEEALNQHVDRVREAQQAVTALQVESKRLDWTLRHTAQWMGVVRFNPFRNTGGDQSFAWALLDGEGNGVVLTSLHARDNTRVYCKPLHNWESIHSLTEEEIEAIARARPQEA